MDRSPREQIGSDLVQEQPSFADQADGAPVPRQHPHLFPFTQDFPRQSESHLPQPPHIHAVGLAQAQQHGLGNQVVRGQGFFRAGRGVEAARAPLQVTFE